MSRPGRPPRSQQRLLTREDEALWKAVASTLEPVRRKSDKHRFPAAEATQDVNGHSEQPVLASLLDEGDATLPPADQPLSDLRPATRPVTQQSPPPLAEFDRRLARRLAGGRITIDARLDLHGMRAAEAHAALRAFIFGCYARGQRNLLVITGKGDEADSRALPFELPDRPGRGVLKRSVPGWLAAPELRSVIVSYTQAHARHGGEGALYVQLRSRRTKLRG